MKTPQYNHRLFNCHEQIEQAVQQALTTPEGSTTKVDKTPAIVNGVVVKGSPEFAEWYEAPSVAEPKF